MSDLRLSLWFGMSLYVTEEVTSNDFKMIPQGDLTQRE